MVKSEEISCKYYWLDSDGEECDENSGLDRFLGLTVEFRNGLFVAQTKCTVGDLKIYGTSTAKL